MKTYVIGHKKPDLDSVVAAISVARLFQLQGEDSYVPAIAEDINEETKFVFEKFGATEPEILTADKLTTDDKIVLVDHNEAEQRADIIDPESIIKIIDHHKVNLNLSHPVYIDIKPWGSSATVIWNLYRTFGIDIEKDIATLMLCAVLSDTVGLKSSTTTDKDREALKELQYISGISDIEGLTLEIFKAKSNISALTSEQIVKNDYKIFEFAKKTFIGQIETVEQSELLNNRKNELLDAMTKVKQEEGVDLLFLAVTDILRVNTKLLILGELEATTAQKAFSGVATNSVLDIGPKMSRKKDIAPAIEKALI